MLIEDYEDDPPELEEGMPDPGVGAVFQSVDDLQQTEGLNALTPRVFNEIRSMLTVNSTTFSVYVEAEIRGAKAVRRWVVRREGARLVPILTERITYPYYRQMLDEDYNDDWRR